MFQDIKTILVYNFRDIWALVNSELIILWFLISFNFLLFPIINLISLVTLTLIIILSVKYFIKEITLSKEYLEFFVNPAENYDLAPKIEKMFKIKREDLKNIVLNSILTFILLNINGILFFISVYIFVLLMSSNIFLKNFFIFLIIIFSILFLTVELIFIILSPLILLKAIEADSYKNLFYDSLRLWEELQDENTIIFFRSLFFDTFWRIITISIISFPIILFILSLYKLLFLNIFFSIFIGWLILSILLGLFVTLFIIDFTKNYYIYFSFV